VTTQFPDLACARCRSNRFTFPRAAEDMVVCEDCGMPATTLGELEAKFRGAEKPRPKRR
jgi:hypothetical protein